MPQNLSNSKQSTINNQQLTINIPCFFSLMSSKVIHKTSKPKLRLRLEAVLKAIALRTDYLDLPQGHY